MKSGWLMQCGISWRGLVFSTPEIMPHIFNCAGQISMRHTYNLCKKGVRTESIPGSGKGVPSYRWPTVFGSSGSTPARCAKVESQSHTWMYSSLCVPRWFTGRKPPETKLTPRTPPSKLDILEPRSLPARAAFRPLRKPKGGAELTASCWRRLPYCNRLSAGAHLLREFCTCCRSPTPARSPGELRSRSARPPCPSRPWARSPSSRSARRCDSQGQSPKERCRAAR